LLKIGLLWQFAKVFNKIHEEEIVRIDMRWIIEAGTTKTDSIIISKSGIEDRKLSPGLNPVSDKDFSQKIIDLCTETDLSQIQEVYYYGSGCINDTYNQPIVDVIQSYLGKHADVLVEDDLLAAAKSTFGNNSGIATIIGTGSNIGYYDGRSICDRVQSCGYLLGDEGGGYRIGQSVFLRYCRGFLSQEEMTLIESETPISASTAITKLYKSENQRQYLASFSKYITQLSSKTQEEILSSVFDELFQNMILPMWNKHQVPISLVGSISFHFKDRLMYMFDNFNIIAGSILKSPIEGLIKYHSYE
jgi:glucosamine kinase